MESYIYVLVFAILNCFVPQKHQKQTTTILWLFMMLMCGFRAYDVGTDTNNYVRYQRSAYTDGFGFGSIYIVLKEVASCFPNEETAFLMIMAVLTYLPLIFITRRVSIFPSLTLLMYIIPCGIFFNESFNIARQSIAIVYILLSAVAISNKKNKLSYFFVFIAFLFHPYVIFFVFFYFLKGVRFTQRIVNFLMLLTILIGLLGTLTGIQSFLSTLTILFGGSSNELFLKLAKYGDGYDISSGFSIVGQLSHMLPMVALCVFGCNRHVENNTYYKMMVCGCAITNVLVSVIFCERFASTFTLAQLLAVPVIYKTSNKYRRLILFITLVMTTLLYIYNLKGYSMDADLWTPYHTIFN